MKKIFVNILALLFISMSVNANELESKINKVYDKGSDVAEGYISNFLDGPGDTEVSIEKKRNKEGSKPTGSIMIVRPLSIAEDSVFFYQAQLNSYHVLGENRQSLNYGIGKRFLSDSKNYFWGMNTFLDLDIEENSRLGFGSEFKATAFSVNGNYYLDVFGGGNQVGVNTERVLDGYDFNILGQIPYLPWINIGYNNYTWDAEKGSTDSEGEVISGNINLTHGLTLEAGYDDNSINNKNNYVKLKYIHGKKKRPTIGDGFSSTAFQDSDVSSDMLTKVKRSNIITLEVQTSGVVVVNGNL